MSKPSQLTISKKEMKAIMKEWRTTTNARKIAQKLNLPHRQVMLYLEQNHFASYSDGSYS